MHRYKRWSSGRWAFSQLLSEGLKPDDVLVDYGCGTLRMGLHAIRYLAPGNYWGLDINEKVLKYAFHTRIPAGEATSSNHFPCLR